MAKRSKNQIRREKAKLRKLGGSQNALETANANSIAKTDSEVDSKNAPSTKPPTPEILLEAEPESLELLLQYASVFKQFSTDPVASTVPNGSEHDHESAEVDNDDNEENNNGNGINGDLEDDESESESVPLSARQLRKRNKVSLASLKAFCSNPSVVEVSDADAKDPYLLVYLKAQLNVVPVPQHWSSKREFLSGRKGVEKLPFQLPKYIADTGIQEMRNVVGDDSRTLKQLQRERVQPKMGKLDIDYQKLHDAFFKYQSKPKMYAFGDVYYEGREATDDYTEQIQDMKPGVVSNALREAIGLLSDSSIVPPWIGVMERLGRPPSYAGYLIPGMDVPYSNTGYVLDSGSLETAPVAAVAVSLPVEHWGHMQDADEEESEEEESEEEEEDDDDDDDDNVARGSEEESNKVSINANNSQGEDSTEEKVEITEYSRYGGLKLKSTTTESEKVEEHQEESTPGSKLLYHILEQASTDKSGLLHGEKKYQI